MTSETDTWDEKKRQAAKRAFVVCYRACANVSEACRTAKVGRSTAYRWRGEDPAFALSWDEAQERAIDEMEEAARKRALDGSDVLMIFLLKANRPEKYRETVKIDWRNITQDQLLLLARGGSPGSDSPGDRLAAASGVTDGPGEPLPLSE